MGWSSARTSLTGTASSRALEGEEDLEADATLARVDRQGPAERVDAGPEGDGPCPGRGERRVLAAPPEREPAAVVHHHEAHAALARLGAHVDALRAAVTGRVDDGLVHHELEGPGELAGQPLEPRVRLEAHLD